MAALFEWQFAGALLYVGIGDTALRRFVGGSHFTLDFTLFVLMLLRGPCGLANLGRRLPHAGRLGRAAVIGHPVLPTDGPRPGTGASALVRVGQAVHAVRDPLMPGRDDKIGWMVVSGDLLQHWLAFTLLAVVLGHAAMALLNRKFQGTTCWRG